MKTPKIRFKGYTETWEQRKFSEITDLKSASRVHKEEWKKEGIPFYRSSDVMAAFNGAENEKAFISEELYEKLSAVSGKIGKGDVLVTGGGSVGKPYLVPDNKPLYTKDADLLWIKANEKLDSRFTYVFFFSPSFCNYLSSVSHVGTIAHYTITQLGNTPISFPNIEEQKKIGEYFMQLDHLITLHQRKCEEAKKIKKYMLQKMFPKQGTNVPEIRFLGYTDAWEQRKVGDIATITAGGTPSTKEILYWEPKEIPWMSSGEVHKKYLYETDEKISEEGLKNSSAKWIEKGSVLIALAGQGKTRGTSAIAMVPLTTNQSIAAIKFDDLIDPFYAFQNLDSRYDELRNISSGDGTRGGLNKQLLSDLDLQFPTLEEQTKIGKYFKNLDHLITLHQRKCEEAKKIKKYMLQKMFPKQGTNVPEIRFLGYTDAWEQRKLGDVVDVCSGRDYKHLEEGDIPVYGTGGYILSVSEALSEDKDAIGIGRKGTIDKPFVLKAPFWTVDTLFYCIPKEDYDLSFVSAIYQNVNWKAMDESTGVPSLSKTAINKVELLAPKFDEQKKLGEYFDNLDNLITLHQQKCENLKKLKEFALQNLFV